MSVDHRIIKKRALTKRIFGLSLRTIKKLPHFPFLFIALPCSLFLILIFPFVKIKFIRLCSDRIGHYAMNTELLLCHLDEIKRKEKKVKYFFYLLNAPICNVQLHIMWKRVIRILPFTKIIMQVDNVMQFIFRDKYKNSALKKFETGAGNEDVEGYFKKFNTHLSFTNIELQRGRQLLLTLGIPIGARYVCLYVRDATYLSRHYPKKDWSYHFYRDCDIQNFSKAALYLANKGYYVIRMGKAVAKAFNIKNPKIIDYAKNQLRSDFLDIYLTAHCQFFISTSAGLDGVAQIFRKPILFVNVAPLQHQLQYWYPCNLFIIKNIFDKTKNHFISLKELDRKILGIHNLNKTFEENNWEIVDNNADEILEAVSEMESFIFRQEYKEKNNPFRSLLENSLTFSMLPHRHLLRSDPEKFYIKMCDQFWLRNQFLFSE